MLVVISTVLILQLTTEQMMLLALPTLGKIAAAVVTTAFLHIFLHIFLHHLCFCLFYVPTLDAYELFLNTVTMLSVCECGGGRERHQKGGC